MSGLFVVFEGADICGKSTQVEMLVSRLEAYKIPVVGMSFPRYDTAVGKAIGRYLNGQIWTAGPKDDLVDRVRDDALVFQALQTLDKVEASPGINRLLQMGRIVVSSRWWQSALIYGADLGLNVDTLHESCSVLQQADLNLLLNVSEERAVQWRPEARDRYERDRDKQQRIRKRYQEMWLENKKHSEWIVIDGEDSPDKVHELVFSAVFQRILDLKKS